MLVRRALMTLALVALTVVLNWGPIAAMNEASAQIGSGACTLNNCGGCCSAAVDCNGGAAACTCVAGIPKCAVPNGCTATWTSYCNP